jgi:Ca2+/Na+ antiporter
VKSEYAEKVTQQIQRRRRGPVRRFLNEFFQEDEIKVATQVVLAFITFLLALTTTVTADLQISRLSGVFNLATFSTLVYYTYWVEKQE